MNVFQNTKNFLEEKHNGVISITGPTASGKTGLSIKLAKYLEAKSNKKIEIISIDSRQIYRECDISAAKITQEEMQGVIHHGIDITNLDEEYNVVKFQQYAFEKIKEIQARGNVVFLVGGTMLWLDAITENYVFSEDIENDQFLKSTKKSEPRFESFKIGIEWDRKILYDRINARAVDQFESGLIEETKTILKKYPDITKSAFTSFGYAEIKKYLDGETTYEEALKTNQQRNRNYAKKQLTWWRGREDVEWINGSEI